MTVPDIEIDNATTRSKLIDDGTELKFVWQENDAIGVVPLNGRPLSFPIHAENAQKNTAVFDGGDWALKTSTKYAAFFPIKKDNQNTDIKNIAFDYEGQTETNYAKFDFLATGAVQPKDGAVKFTMQRLSAILKIRITMPAGSYGRYGTLIPNKTLFNVKGTLDLSGSEPKYNVTGKAKFIHTQLNADKTSSSEWIYEVYMMIPATDLSDQPLTFSITSDKGLAYEAFLQGKNFEAGKAYLLEATASDAQITNANLIAAAESDNSITFEKESGKVNVNNATNQTLLKQVKKINVISKNDSTVCKQIGYFPALERLDCNNNGITSLDISKNKALTYLDCSNNILTSLDVSYNTNLKYLYCNSNYLTSLDLSNNTALYSLICSNNKLTSLDLSNNTELYLLYCNSNQLTSINLSNNTALSHFQCESNSLTALDVSNNPALQIFYCGHNQITSLDVSNNTKLTHFGCNRNQITSLDVSNNTSLQGLICEVNQITSLDVSNNTKLTTLQCGSNLLTSLDVSQNTLLKNLDCFNNKITSLDVSNNMDLVYLDCSSNQLRTFTVTNHPSLKSLRLRDNPNLASLNCTNNVLENLVVAECPKLSVLECQGNNLNSLNVSSLTNLSVLGCYDNLMQELDIRNNTLLKRQFIACGRQWTDSNKTSNQILTLYVTSENSGVLPSQTTLNSYVQVVVQD